MFILFNKIVIFLDCRVIMCPMYRSDPVVAGTPSQFKKEYCNNYVNA